MMAIELLKDKLLCPLNLGEKIWRPVSITPLVTFRIAFGLLMFFSLLRFCWRGWVAELYLKPKFHFSYWGLEWIQPLNGLGMYVLFVSLIVAALCIALGLLYRVAIVWFFLAFTYVELLDVTTYLNHYYFISLVGLLLVFLPAGRYYALDVWLRPKCKRTQVPSICIDILKFQMAIVYIFAGLAKLNPEWLLAAQPLSIWLPAKSHLPLVGQWMYAPWVAYLFSWFGAAYDLFIVFFLLHTRTRGIAYLFVLLFHIATAIFFPAIGMFPYVMIMGSLIFFSTTFHERLLVLLPGYKKVQAEEEQQYATVSVAAAHKKLWGLAIALYILVQIVVPLRFLAYPGYLFWTEEGYRFSWRVMLMEKSGTAYFTVKSGKQIFEVNNAAFLTPLQEKMMSTQPDLILKYAHLLAEQYAARGLVHPEVYAEIYVSLNGRHSAPFVDTSVNLAEQPLSWGHYDWVLPFKK